MEKDMKHYVYVLIQYNNIDSHDADVLGVYLTMASAKEKLLSLVKADFHMSVYDSVESSDEENPPGHNKQTWEHTEPHIKDKLKSSKVIDYQNKYGFVNYVIRKMVVKE